MICDRANAEACKLYAVGTCVGEAKKNNHEERLLGVNTSGVAGIECGHINQSSYSAYVTGSELHDKEFAKMISGGSR